MSCDVVLLQPPIRDFYLTHKRTIPYGLARIAAVLRDDGVNVALVDGLATRRSRRRQLPADLAYLEGYYGRQDISPFALFSDFRHFGRSEGWLVDRVASLKPRVVGVSALFSAYADYTLSLVAKIVERLPQCHVVVGGHHATAFPGECLQRSGAHFVIRGDGEWAFAALARLLLRGEGIASRSRQLKEIDGLCFAMADGQLHIGAPAEVSRLAALPLPALDLIDQGYYCHRNKGRAVGRSVIVTSRGCRLRCSYCAVGSKASPSFRQREVAAIGAELEQAIVGYGARFIDFEDENISWDRHRYLQILELLIGYHQRFGIECRAMNGLLPRTLDQEIVSAMACAGFKELNLSLGSSSRSRLRHFRRPDERPHFDKALRFAEQQQLRAVGYIVAAGMGQPAEESLEDLFFLATRRVLVGLSIYYPAPGSLDFQQALEQDLLGPAITWRGAALPLEQATSRDEAITLLRLARVINFIKAELDSGRGVPAPTPLPQLLALDDRAALGRQLLAALFHDGALRGVDRQGGVFVHRFAPELLEAFVRRVQQIPLRGVTSSAAA